MKVDVDVNLNIEFCCVFFANFDTFCYDIHLLNIQTRHSFHNNA